MKKDNDFVGIELEDCQLDEVSGGAVQISSVLSSMGISADVGKCECCGNETDWTLLNGGTRAVCKACGNIKVISSVTDKRSRIR